MLSTTFALLRQHDACEGGYRKLARHLGGIAAYGKDTPIPLLTILESNGLNDCLWSLRAVPAEQEEDRDRIARLFAIDCAERSLVNWGQFSRDDRRPQMSIEVARRFAEGQATAEELSAAWSAAWSARSAARSAESAESAAWSAESAESAAWSAERDWQEQLLRKHLTPEPKEEAKPLPEAV